MITGSLQQKNGYYYAVLYLKVDGKRKCKWIPTKLPVNGTSNRKAQKPSTRSVSNMSGSRKKSRERKQNWPN